MNKNKKEEKKGQGSKGKIDDASRLQAFLRTGTSNPIDDVIGEMLESDASSCKLANARLSQIKEKEDEEKNKK